MLDEMEMRKAFVMHNTITPYEAVVIIMTLWFYDFIFCLSLWFLCKLSLFFSLLGMLISAVSYKKTIEYLTALSAE